MCHHQKCLCPPSHTIQALPEVLRVKRTKTFVQHHDFGILQQRPRQKNPSPFSLRKLPARLADDLVESGRHSLQQWSQTEFVAQLFSLVEVLGGVWVGPPQQEIEAERCGGNRTHLSSYSTTFFADSFFPVWRWVFFERGPELDRKIPVSSKELRRRKKEFFDDLQQH